MVSINIRNDTNVESITVIQFVLTCNNEWVLRSAITTMCDSGFSQIRFVSAAINMLRDGCCFLETLPLLPTGKRRPQRYLYIYWKGMTEYIGEAIERPAVMERGNYWWRSSIALC